MFKRAKYKYNLQVNKMPLSNQKTRKLFSISNSFYCIQTYGVALGKVISLHSRQLVEISILPCHNITTPCLVHYLNAIPNFLNM